MSLQPPLIELGRARWRSGSWRGMRQAAWTLQLSLTRSEMDVAVLRHYDEVLACVGRQSSFECSAQWMDVAVAGHPLLGRVLKMTMAILEAMGMPVMDGVKVFGHKDVRQFAIGLPAIASHIRAPVHALEWACGLMNHLEARKPWSPRGLLSEINRLVKQQQAQSPAGVNTLPFLKAAHDLGIPWQHVANNIYQFGWGSRSRWLDSSFTDQTSTISASLARDKVACAQVLSRVGLPVPKHQLVASAEHALKVAQTIGYPVVVKPANLDGGTGVVAGVRDATALVAAYKAAAKLTHRVLVEQHVQGNDYRVRICTGVVIGVVIRQAAAVVGDGLSSVRSLINGVNAKRAHQNMPADIKAEYGHTPIRVDDEVQVWLSAQDLSLDSVPTRGQRVRLRGAANVSLGGTTWDVTEQAHADNLELALRSAAALRLDVAGVDLLLPDIARSYKETGGVVCEVNAKPQFSSGSAHRDILQRLLPCQGRIPVVGVQHVGFSTAVMYSVVQALSEVGVRVRLVTTPLACEQALLCKDTDAVVCHLLDHKAWTRDQSPVDRFECLFIEPQVESVLWAAGQQRVLSTTADAHFIIDELTHHLRLACLGREREIQ